MKTINTIAVFDDDHYFLALLKGYCCAGNIEMAIFAYDRKNVTDLQKLKPDLVIVPLASVMEARKEVESALLKEVSVREKIKVMALNKNATRCHTIEHLKWIDAVIENPYDIGEIDAYLKKTVLSANAYLNDFAVFQEKRSGSDRRKIKINNHGEINYSDRRLNGDRRTCWERRHNRDSNQAKVTSEKQFYLDRRNKCLYIKGEKIELTPKEFELLLFLSTDMERVFAAEEIIEHLWPENSRATKSDLYQHMHLLRKKIELDPNSPQWIRNIKGFGYKLETGAS